MKKTYIAYILFLLLLSCFPTNKSGSEYPIIDLVGSIEKYQRVYCSDYFTSIELIPLETKEECLLPNVPFPKITLKDSFVFIDGDLLYAFDTSGKFLNQIGKKGQGPNEHLYLLNFFLNTDRPVIYIEDLKKILEYDFSGNHLRTIQTPELDHATLINLSYVGDETFVGSIFNDGKNDYKYCLFNHDGEIVKCFPNYVFFNRDKPRVSTSDRSLEPNIVVDVWNAEEMKEILTEEYFLSQTIKDQQAHQKLKEILKNLKDDDNPVVVVAQLK